MSIRLSRAHARLSVLIGLTTVASLLWGIPSAAALAIEPGSTDRSVPVSPASPKADPLPVMPSHTAGKVLWPSRASAVVDVGTASVVGTLPVRVSPAAGGAPSKVRVEVLGRSAETPLAVKLSRADGSSGPARVKVELDYSAFREAFGGAYASRLELRVQPDCGLSAGCPQTFLDSVNDFRAGVISAEVDLQATKPDLPDKEQALVGIEAIPPSELVIALSSSGDAKGVGTFARTDLKESGTWSHGGNSGNFSYNYPLAAPPVPGGLGPKLSLDYSTATVDGQTAAMHIQSGLLGEGWTVAGGGFIESTFRPCSVDKDHSPTWTNLTGDPCWRYENYQLSWSGKSGELAPTGTANVWKVENDDAAKVEYVAASGYWKVTTTDGTQWFFGRQRLPGWAAGARETGSVLSQEMFANHSDEPCFHPSGYTYSHCTKPYRWMLDYVVDVHGNSMSYWYSRYSNLAGSNNSGAGVFSYDRDAVLDRIEYGTRAGNETNVTPPAKIEFTNSDRCLIDCGTEATPTTANWYDTPFDLRCTAAPCNNNLSPSYWTTKRLSKITSKVWTGAGTTYKSVDEWSLGHSFPGGTDVPTLWLDSISRKGFDAAGASLTMPALTTHGRKDRNRADYDPGASMADPQKYRIDYLDTEAGARIEVSYLPMETACTWWSGKAEAEWPNYNHNSARCFMQYVTNRSGVSGWSWWHKFVVDKVTEKDLVGLSPPKVTSYQYTMDGATSNHPLVLWGYTTGVWASPKKAMSAWKGYPTVITTVGVTGTQSKTKRLYYRGLDRDTGLDPAQEFWRQSSVVDSLGTSVVDHRALTGQVREEVVYDGTNEVTKTIRTPTVWQTGGGALPTWQTPPERITYMNRETSTKTLTKIADGTWRTAETVSAFDTTYGTVTQVDDKGQTSPALSTDDVCTRYTYNRNTITAWIVGTASRVETVGVGCGTSAVYPGDLVSDTRVYYDGATSLTAPPTRALTTKTEQAKSHNGTAATYVTTGEAGFDQWGRRVMAKDPLARRTDSVYTQDAGGLLSQIKVTNPAGHVTLTGHEPLRGLPLTVTDPNNKVITGTYDPLGRLRKVWQPGHPTSGTPDAEYVYSVTKTSWPFIQTKALGPNGNQISSFEIYDGLLRQRQSQTTAPDGKRVIADTAYDGRGLKAKSSIFYNNASGPTSTLYNVDAVADGQIERQNRFVYDGAGRRTAEELWKQNVLQARTTIVYQGDRAGIIPPTGGTVTQDIVDARGRVVEKRQYQSPSGFTGSFAKTLYTYDDADRLRTIADPGGNLWTYEHDLLGRPWKTIDPDTGTTTSTFDNAGQVLSTTDARGQVLFFEYDSLGRKTKQRADTATGTIMADWVYDTVAKGQTTSTSRFDGATTYTSAVSAYDDGYRPLTTTDTVPGFGASGGTLSYTVTNTYKANGALATRAVPAVGGLAAETITHTYTDQGFAKRMTSGLATYVNDTTYHYDGLVYRQFLGAAGKQVRLSNDHDPATRRLSKLWISTEDPNTPNSFFVPYDYTYGYDTLGNIKSIGGNVHGIADQEECFSYDYLRRLKEAWTQTSGACTAPQRTGADPYWRQWTFDSVGNRLTQTDKDATAGDTSWTYQVGAAGSVKPHQIKKVDATGPKAGTALRSFGYDAAGNTTSRTTETGAAQTLAWDKEGHLASVTEGSSVTSYVYDTAGQRLLTKAPSKTTLFLPDGLELEKLTSGGSILGTRHYSDNRGKAIAVRDAAGLKWTCMDHHGTSTVQIDPVSLATSRRRSMPYGEARGTQPTFVGTKGYVGGTKDTTGLTHLGAREYDPSLGRFISRDPVMDRNDPQQINGYAYSNNSPITFSDPTGLVFTCDEEGNTCSNPAPPPPPDESTSTWGGAPSGTGSGTGCYSGNRSPSCGGSPSNEGGATPGGSAATTDPKKSEGTSKVKEIAATIGSIAGKLSNIVGFCAFLVICATVSLILAIVAAIANIIAGKIYDAIVGLVAAGLGVLLGGIKLPGVGKVVDGLSTKVVDMVMKRLIKEGEAYWIKITVVREGKRVPSIALSPVFRRVQKEIEFFAYSFNNMLNAVSQMMQNQHAQGHI